MRVAVLFLVLFLVSSLRTPQQQALYDNSMMTKLRSSNLGRAVLLMAQVHEKADYNTLFDALSDLGRSFQQRIEGENGSFSNDATSVESDRQFYKKQVSQYTTEVAQHQIELRSLLKDRSQLENSLNNKRQELNDAKKMKNIVTNTLTILDYNLRKKTEEYNNAITVLDKAIELLEGSKNGAFIQEKKQEFHDTSAKMQEHLEPQNFYFQPLAMMLVQVATEQYVDQSNIVKATRILQQFRDQVNNSRLALVNTYESEKKQNLALLAIYTQKCEQLANSVVVGYQADIEGKNAEIEVRAALLKDAQSNLEQAQNNLAQVDAAWEKRTHAHNELIQEYNHELGVLGECIKALNANGVRRSN